MNQGQGMELVEVTRAEGQTFNCAPWVHEALPREEFKRGKR
jgi:hypothetical protein